MLPGKPLKGSPLKPQTRVEKLMLRRQQLMANKNIAKSAAHEGVVERPMDKGLSKMLEIRRAQKAGSGTSVSRLKKTREEEEEEMRKQLGASVFRLTEGTEEENEEAKSVGRLKVDRLQLNRLKPIPQSKKPTIGDLG